MPNAAYQVVGEAGGCQEDQWAEEVLESCFEEGQGSQMQVVLLEGLGGKGWEMLLPRWKSAPQKQVQPWQAAAVHLPLGL